MKNLVLAVLYVFLSSCYCAFGQNKNYTLVIHGGAGNITPAMGMQKQQEYNKALTRALQVGDSVLRNGGTALDAVEQTIHVLEDCPLFNAAKGAVFNAEGKNELDASIMDGKTGLAGAVAGITIVKNPISAARLVMEKSAHVLMIGKGAEKFAIENHLQIVNPQYFFTQERWNDYIKARQKAEGVDKKHGTVGCVALDTYGNLAAGTSTGGMTYKKYGRVGDSPVIGAGTYADNNTCAVSATGHGEFFIRNVVAYDISALMKYKNMSLKDAADEVIMNKLKPIGGTGGVVCVDKKGNVAMPFNTEGMFRGYIKSNGEIKVLMFGN